MFNLKAFDLFYNYCVKLAGKADDLKAKHPEISADIDEFVLSDPSGKNKYLEWMVKQLKMGFKKEDIIPTVKLFYKVIDKLDKKDINQYGTVKDLENILKDIDKKSVKEKRQEFKEGGKKLYEDDDYVLIRPDTKNACITYGKNTEWCITMENASYYEQYKRDNVVFYFLINKNPTNDPQDKIAFSCYRNESGKFDGWEIYDANDRQMNLSEVKDPNSILEDIINIIRNDIQNVPINQFKKIFEKYENGEKLSESEILELIESDFSYSSILELINRLPKNSLFKLKDNNNAYIREAVAKNAPIDVLNNFINDPDKHVLIATASRIDYDGLLKMTLDSKNNNSTVLQGIFLKRLPDEYFSQILNETFFDRKINFNDMIMFLVKWLPQNLLPNALNLFTNYFDGGLKTFKDDFITIIKHRMKNENINVEVENYLENIIPKTSSNKNRAKQDVRNDQPLRKNYDYGEGLYFGNMDKYKSVSDFLKKKRKKRKKILNAMLGGSFVK